MQWKNDHIALGLDVGQTAVKAVLLTRKGSELLIARCEVLSLWAEGILDEEELYKSLGAWLQEKKLAGTSTCIGLPQYLTTSQISDFPPGISGELLDKMVDDETAHLSGLSDGRFVYDYQVLQATAGRNNPVLIGICRETVVEEYASRLQGVKVNVQDMAMTGLAMVNAFFYLYPRERQNEKLQILIDLGTENSTLAIVAQGQVLYVSSLMFGSRRITKALAQEFACTENEAEMRKKTYQAAWGDPDCPILPVIKQLERELDSALEHWRQSEPENAAVPVLKIWLTGGGAQLWGLNAQLIRTYACQVGIFGPPDPNVLPEQDVAIAENVNPDLTIAFGLALQGITAAECKISLIPDLLRWQQSKVARFRYLLWSAGLLLMALVAFLLGFYFNIISEQAALEERLNELNACRSLVPKLDDSQAQAAHCQKMLIPLVEYGTRGWRFMSTLEELQRAMSPQQKQNDGWCIYVADEFSYRAATGITAAQKDPAQTAEKKPASPFRSVVKTPAATGTTAQEEKLIPVFQMEFLSKMIVGGFSPRQTDKGKYEVTKDILDSLNSGTLFAGADWFSDWDEAHVMKVFEPWQDFFSDKTKPRNKQQRDSDPAEIDFRTQLPFRNLVVRKPPPPEPVKKRRR